MRSAILLAATLAALGLSSGARADDGAACGDAFDQSQVRRSDGKLLEARTLFRVCSSPTCSRTQQKLCSEWLGDMEARVPSFVLSAKDGSGADIVDVSVTMDGVQVATKLDGRELEVDPGPHSFVFQRADGSKAETTAVAVERGKGKVVAVTLGQPAAPALPPSALPVPAYASTPPGPTRGASSSWKTAGWVLGGAGVVGVGVGTILGFVAISDNNAAQCNASHQCLAGPLSNARGAALGSDIGFIGGAVLLAGGAALVLFGPNGTAERAVSTVAIAPVVGPGGGGLAVAGSW
jgi:hypothetical protein